MKYYILLLSFILTTQACSQSIENKSVIPNQDGIAQQEEKSINITVYRSPTCGCCKGWVEHLRNNHFNVTDIESNHMDQIKSQYDVPKQLSSCHTAIIDGYIIEGHVPAKDIKKLISTKSDIRGLSIPQMPVGTPGMEMGNRKDPFSVISFDKEGKTAIFNHYENY